MMLTVVPAPIVPSVSTGYFMTPLSST